MKESNKFLNFLQCYILGDFIYKDAKFASMFLNVDNDLVSGFSIDTNDGDEFFKNYQKINLFVNNNDIEINNEINKNLDHYSKFKQLKFNFNLI